MMCRGKLQPRQIFDLAEYLVPPERLRAVHIQTYDLKAVYSMGKVQRT